MLFAWRPSTIFGQGANVTSKAPGPTRRRLARLDGRGDVGVRRDGGDGPWRALRTPVGERAVPLALELGQVTRRPRCPRRPGTRRAPSSSGRAGRELVRREHELAAVRADGVVRRSSRARWPCSARSSMSLRPP